MSVKDTQTAPWLVHVAKTAYEAGFQRSLAGPAQSLVECFETWWDRTSGLVPVAMVKPLVDGPAGDDQGGSHQNEKKGVEDSHALKGASIGPRTWTDGVKDAIKIAEYRLQHYELYRHGEAMRTKPEVFATIEELLIFLRAMLERGEYASRCTVDVALKKGKPDV